MLRAFTRGAARAGTESSSSALNAARNLGRETEDTAAHSLSRGQRGAATTTEATEEAEHAALSSEVREETSHMPPIVNNYNKTKNTQVGPGWRGQALGMTGAAAVTVGGSIAAHELLKSDARDVLHAASDAASSAANSARNNFVDPMMKHGQNLVEHPPSMHLPDVHDLGLPNPTAGLSAATDAFSDVTSSATYLLLAGLAVFAAYEVYRVTR